MKRYSDEELATIAESFRRLIGLKPKDKLDVFSLVKLFQSLKDSNWKITFHEAPSSYMRGALARAEPSERRVHYKEGLMARLANGDQVAKSVFLEEICHVLLKHDARVLNHSIGRDVRANANPELDAMEQEAQRMRWFIQAPISELYGVGSAKEIIDRYELTPDEAELYHQHIKSTENRYEKRTRPLPQGVIDFLEEQRKRYPGKPTALPRKLEHPKQVASQSLDAWQMPSKAQYSGYLTEPCSHCKMPLVVQSGCKICRNCGEEYGCN